MKAIRLGANARRADTAPLFALVDDEDFAALSAFNWHVKEERRPDGSIACLYARTSVRRPDGSYADVFMHKMLTGWPKTDHKDHNGLNNQRSNLRQASTAQNNHNQRPRVAHSSAYKGVTWNRQRRKWQAEIKANGKRNYLGLFTSEEAAAAAYDRAALAAYGDFAYLNGVSA